MIAKFIIFLAITIAIISTTRAQMPFANSSDTYRIAYTSFSNGKQQPNARKIVVYSNDKQTLITNEKDVSGKETYPIELSIIDRANSLQQLYTLLNATNSIATTDSTAIKSQKIELLNESKIILGYECKKAKTVVNSNTIELWYTTALKIKGAPTALGQDLGLVLEMVRNGNYTITSESVKKEAYKAPAGFASAQPRQLDVLSYRDEIWRSRYITIPLFKNQIINFSETDTTSPDVLRFANGTIVVKKIKFPQFESAKNIFLELKEQSNGDAYDRTGTVFLIPTDKPQSFLDGLKKGAASLPIYENGNGKQYQGVVATNQYSPAIELMRFFTPFGINGYNHIQLKGKTWHEVVPYRQDISEFASLLNGKEVYIGVFIGNYDKGGHRIDAEITIHKEGNDKVAQKIIPLFNTLNIMEMAGQQYATMFDNPKGVLVHFELKEPLKNALLRYTTTGHGGWANGDEFVRRENTILLDSNVVLKVVPWREDCGSYRLFNPASGNFSTGLSSSDLSRSNWCPGTVTNPYIIQLGDLPPGKHTLQVIIPQGSPEGGSFSAWNVSGTIVGD